MKSNYLFTFLGSVFISSCNFLSFLMISSSASVKMTIVAASMDTCFIGSRGAFMAPVVRSGMEEMELPTSMDEPLQCHGIMLSPKVLDMLYVFVSFSEGMRRLAGSGASSQSDGACADPAPMPDCGETNGISLCGAHAAICSSNADWPANPEQAPSDAGSKPDTVHDDGCSSPSHNWPPTSSIRRWVAAGASGWAKTSPPVIWTAPSAGKDDEGRDCGVACPWTDRDPSAPAAGDPEPEANSEARPGDGCLSNGGGEMYWACAEDRPCSIVAVEVPAAEEQEVFGSMSARVSARGVPTRGGRGREGFRRRRDAVVEGSAGMGASRRMYAYVAMEEERNEAGCSKLSCFVFLFFRPAFLFC
jgi:hypothetical protein